MSYMDLSKNNTDRKSYAYQITQLEELWIDERDYKARKRIRSRIATLRKNILKCLDKRGYKYTTVSTKENEPPRIIKNLKTGNTEMVENTMIKTRYGPRLYPRSRAMTKEEHEAFMKAKNEKN